MSTIERRLLAQARVAQTLAEAASLQVASPGPPMTASVGVSTFGGSLRTAEAMIGAADEALYHAKKSGRDRVCHWSSLPAAVGTGA